MSKTEDRIAEARYFESEFGLGRPGGGASTIIDYGLVASRCKGCGGFMSKRSHHDAESSWRRCNNCGDIRPIFTRMSKEVKALHAMLDAMQAAREQA